jgi:hypothetical protein
MKKEIEAVLEGEKKLAMPRAGCKVIIWNLLWQSLKA